MLRATTLPPEILDTIFQFLPPYNAQATAFIGNSHSSLLACSQVSRNWRALALPRVWSELVLPCIPEAEKGLSCLAAFLAETARNPHHNLAYLVRSIEILNSTTCDHDPTLARVIGSIVQILRLLHPSRLRRISIDRPPSCPMSCYDLTPIHHDLARLLPHLTHLQISGIVAHGPSAIALLPLLSPTLTHLTLRECYPLDHLDQPDLAFPIHHIFSLPRLNYLELTHLPTSVKALDLVHALAKWSTLHHLALVACPSLHDDRVIRALALHCPNLTRLGLGGRPPESPGLERITDEAMCTLLDACAGLETLECADLKGLTDKWLGYCARRGVALRRLVLRNCPGVKGTGVTDVSGWEGLEVLEVYQTGVWESVGGGIDEMFERAVAAACPDLVFWRLGYEEEVVWRSVTTW